jgi:hypothetical protein
MTRTINTGARKSIWVLGVEAELRAASTLEPWKNGCLCKIKYNLPRSSIIMARRLRDRELFLLQEE